MAKLKSVFTKIPKWLYYTVLAFAVSLALTLLAKNTTGFAEWYSTNIYPFFVGTVGRITSVLPFSLCEILLYTVIILAAVGVTFTVVRFIKGKGKRKRLMTKVLAVVLNFAVSIFFVFTLFCGINYNRTPFSAVSGFTVEAYTAQELADLCVYILKNANAPDFAKPFTVCHELSHLKGFMREDEANFIAYLACTGSDNVYLQYAGWVYALIYAANALYSAAGSEIYSELMSYADEKVIAELSANSAYWKKYETPVATVATTVNDTYLKSQGQTDGKKSYGRFVDLMISYRKMQTSE